MEVKSKIIFTCVDDVIKSIDKLGGNLSENMNYYYTDDKGQKVTIMINRWNYIYTYFQNLLAFYTININKVPSMLETVYMMAIQNTRRPDLSRAEVDVCTGIINLHVILDGNPNRDYIVVNNTNILYQKDPDQFNQQFLVEFARRVMSCKTNITSLSLNINIWKNRKQGFGHANMIFIHVGPSQVTFSLYEPHGSDRTVARALEHVDNFMDFLVDSCNKNRGLFGGRSSFKQPSTVISCIRGLQEVVPETQLAGTENTGYCLMYSYLWLYITLRCSSFMTTGKGRLLERGSALEELTIKTILEWTERAILANRTSEELGRLINAFAGMVVSRYMENIKIFYGQKVFNSLDRLMAKHFEPKDEYIRSKTTNPFERIIIKPDTSSLPSRKHDNQPCNRDDDCMSVYCNNKKCTARKDDGEACYIHRECMSDYCDPYLEMCGGKPFKNKKKRG